ncbi:ATP-binding protein [Legionella oakridgensis]|uniref:ATPase n=1 Tax=Legionella oakridgensis TaxID=29423 RepID=A0A0W0X170_9GAMM|nr:AAA family ATPase [Legionella oakridgensis]KTD38265.1 ATPase [Legionella oakridgensis]STY15603.1 ATPase [Legionella longbeachae]
MFKRQLKMDLPKHQSAFLWGARQTGKSSFLKSNYPKSIYYDLLDTHELARLSKAPYLLREEILAAPKEQIKKPIIIDEIQKIPELLNEIHWLIENSPAHFILCGSSARKLKTQSTNILGGRAWPFYFFPLVYPEISDFSLLNALQKGLIPNHYLASAQYIDDYLQAYVDVYLTDEIRNEGLVRNLRGFAQFLDIAGLTNGEMINVTNIARDCGIDRSTVQSYFQILEDTLLGYHIYPYKKKVKRDIVSATPKFYLFDVGVANYLAKQKIIALKGAAAGKSFEHYILMELKAYIGMKRKRTEICYWRTKNGLEVDFILSQAHLAIEVKINEQVHQQDLKGLIAFCEENPQIKAMVVSQDKRPRALKINDELTINILPWQEFLEYLWEDKLF